MPCCSVTLSLRDSGMGSSFCSVYISNLLEIQFRRRLLWKAQISSGLFTSFVSIISWRCVTHIQNTGMGSANGSLRETLPPCKSPSTMVWWCMSVIPELFVGQTKTVGSGSSWDNQSSWTDESQAQWKTLNQELRGRVIKEDIWNPSSVFTCTYTRVHMCTYTCKHIPIPHTWTYTYKPCPNGPIRHWMTKKVAGHCSSTGFQEPLSTNRKKVSQNWDFPGTDTIFYPVLKVWSYLDIIVHKRWMSFIDTLSYF